MDWTKIHDAVWDPNEETISKEVKLVSCNSCDWIHFEVDLDHCIKWEKEWAELGQILNYKEHYLNCFNCGNSYKNFGPVVKKNNGTFTVQPILGRQWNV